MTHVCILHEYIYIYRKGYHEKLCFECQPKVGLVCWTIVAVIPSYPSLICVTSTVGSGEGYFLVYYAISIYY